MGISVQSLSEQLIRVEREVAAIRRELARLQARPASDLATTVTEPQPRVKKADKQLLRDTFQQVLAQHHITGKPIGALALQEMMRQEQLGPNEFSQRIITARDE